MKKVLLTAVCAFIATATFAQRASSSSTSLFSSEKSNQPITVGIRAGVNFANMSIESSGYSYTISPDSKTGFNVGLSLDVPILESFYVQSGLYFTTKGLELKERDVKEEANPMYLEIPILASYRYNFSETSQLQINFGPYFAYGIGGKAKTSDYDKYYDEVITYEYDCFGDDGIAENFDCGLQIGTGVTFGKVYVGCAYQFGLTNGAKNKSSRREITAKNRNFMINLGYNF